MKFNSLVREILNEVLTNPYPYEYSERDGGYIFFPDPNNQSILYTVLLLEDPEYTSRLTILFHYTDEDKNIQGTTEMTGTGNEFRVLATVSKIVKEYLSENPNKYDIIQFIAKSKDRSRVSFYTKRLVPLLKAELGSQWNLDIIRDENDPDVTYEFSKEDF